MPRLKLTALALTECLTNAGYHLTSGAYSEIESGASIPRDPIRFIDTVAQCLLLDDPKDKEALARQLAYDLVRSKLGERIAQLTIRPPESSE